MFKSRKLKKNIREIEEGLRSVVIPPKQSEIKKMKSIKKSEETKKWSKEMELKEIKPPYPKCPSCGEYLEDNEVYNKKGRQKYGLHWTDGHKVKWECGNCGAEYESEEKDENLLTFKKGEEPKHKVIYPQKKKKIKKKKTKR